MLCIACGQMRRSPVLWDLMMGAPPLLFQSVSAPLIARAFPQCSWPDTLAHGPPHRSSAICPRPPPLLPAADGTFGRAGDATEAGWLKCSRGCVYEISAAVGHPEITKSP